MRSLDSSRRQSESQCYGTYKDLTGDASAPANLTEAEIDGRVKMFFELEEPDVTYDLREVHAGRPSKFSMFWEKAKAFLEEDVGTAVDDRRHSDVVHLAKAISIRDFRNQVQERCPPDTLIPCDELIRLQFIPSHRNSRTASNYTSMLQVRKMVQQCQWRKEHKDAHYAVCIFRYVREYALLVCDHAMLVCVDDKHRVKVGEPDNPVAAAERGRQVWVNRSSPFHVADHDFTRFSLIPSVALMNEIPSELSGSWYTGKVHVLYKEGAFEPSSPVQHSTELCNMLQEKAKSNPLYSDGGPDHRVTYMSVKLALAALFLKLNLDYLCATRTAPYHSFRNPAERIMSILNLGLQSVGLARTKLDDAMEKEIKKCNNNSQLRKQAEATPAFKESVADSIAPVKILLSRITQRLQLKGEPFVVSTAALSSDIDNLCYYI